MNRKKQILLYIICGLALLWFRNWFAGGYPSAEELLGAYAQTNHMGGLQEVLIEDKKEDQIFILGKAEKGFLSLVAHKNLFNEYYREYSIAPTDDLVFEKDGVAVGYVEDIEDAWYKNPEQYMLQIKDASQKLFSHKENDVIELEISGQKLLEAL